jgi:hypothetical protein
MGHYDECRPGYSEPGYIETKPKQTKSLDEQIETLKKALTILEKQKEESAWPKPYTFYLKANENRLLEDGRVLNLSEKAIERFVETGYEIEFEGTVSKEGVFTCTFIDGVQLVNPIDF